MEENHDMLALSLSVTPVNRTVSHKPPMMPLGLVSPYHQQALNVNHMVQNQVTRDLCTQLRNVEERAVYFMKVKDKTIEDMKKQSAEMELRLRKALSEAEFWKKTSDEKTELCRDLAGKLLQVRKREKSKKVIPEQNEAEEAESSTGENGDDELNTASIRLCKRRRL
ncbi:hypothetical protein CARUB_v10021289mg [Capsella rubella]|uniref:Uncharacterized protein n=1 Tax=Capsella rubella TaxID=81985 RepID=R0I6W3_9BRAS|nr:uncharacterized protein LOC17894463 isoform X1 [Capsella rubella]EOA33815.1 hypothetical protein CARUB_v10021289mg [Capsella rubella]